MCSPSLSHSSLSKYHQLTLGRAGVCWCIEVMLLDFSCAAQLCLFSMEIQLLMPSKPAFMAFFFSDFFARFHYHSVSGHFWIENRFLLKGYWGLRTVDHFYEGQLEIPKVLKPVKDYTVIERWVGMWSSGTCLFYCFLGACHIPIETQFSNCVVNINEEVAFY